jgi:HEAT repeat protein
MPPTNKEKVDAFIRDLRSPRVAERIDAARSLGYFGDPRAIEPLVEAFSDSDTEVVIQAIGSLAQLGDAALPTLAEALVDGDVSIRFAVTITLGRIGSDDAVAILEMLLDDPASDIHLEAHDVLKEINTPAAKDVLERRRR